jgi:uncharacterized NAD-dependent epimerase/dehydratase family protein
MIRSDQKVAILLHGGILGVQGKTGLAMLRFSEAPIVAVIDRDTAGKSLAELTGISRSIPIVASVAEALAYLVVGCRRNGETNFAPRSLGDCRSSTACTRG